MAYSDEPNLIKPAHRWSPKNVAAFAVVLTLVAGILYIPLFQHNLDADAGLIRRGPHQGALYDITVAGTPATIELGWIAPAFSAVITPTPSIESTLEVSGDFGSETLIWNPAKNCFGPGTTRLDPYAHAKLKLTLRQADRVLWRDTLWAYGIHDPHGHTQ